MKTRKSRGYFLVFFLFVPLFPSFPYSLSANFTSGLLPGFGGKS